MPNTMPTSIMQKNYSHCPLKKRPVFMSKDDPMKNGNYLFSSPNSILNFNVSEDLRFLESIFLVVIFPCW